MDAERFDDLTRSLISSPSRRGVLRGLAGAALGQVILLGGARSGAAQTRTEQRFRINKFGCVNVGEKCFGRDSKCCSGICQGNGNRSRCVAHNAGGCTTDDSSCPRPIPCGVEGECYRTTGKAGFCGEGGACDCHPCSKDKDCEKDYGKGAACIVCISKFENSCVGVNGSKGTACVPPAALH